MFDFQICLVDKIERLQFSKVILGHTVKQKSDFRRLHGAEVCFLIPNPWDVGTASILALLGCSALAITSAGLAGSLGQRQG